MLLKDSQVARNEWPMGMVTSVFPGQDGKVHKVEIKTTASGTPRLFQRPVSETVLLLPKAD